jgi:SagB-type dehydrogenase family enzyme
MTIAVKPALSPTDIALAYHVRTKHSLARYAAGPETLDWDAQPNPFREFAGCRQTPLPLRVGEVATRFAQIYAPRDVHPAPLTLAGVGALLRLSMGLSAWKEYGPDRWALRCNPSSGNLHPTEAYVVSRNVPGLEDGVHHYLSREHSLELRCRDPKDPTAAARVWIALTSVHWREAWKYGERAFRYCQLDTGHALGALRYAAGALGWTAQVVDGVGSDTLAALLGLDRNDDFSSAEKEDPDLLIAIDAHPGADGAVNAPPATSAPAAREWSGRANLLDSHPLYRWPVIDQVSAATLGGGTVSQSRISQSWPPDYPPLCAGSDAGAAGLLLERRSAQRFDNKFRMSADVFHRLLDALLARTNAPWDVWSFAPRIHPVLFVHRVEGVEPGLYMMPRHPDRVQGLRAALRPDFQWQTPDAVPAHIPLFRLLPADCRAMAKTVSCHQAIASDGCFSLGMLSEFEPLIRADAWRYRQLHWEAGLLGHVLYLEAEAAGLRGTGIGCYFDDAVHELLGVNTAQFQVLYHFTVGRPLTDERITTLPPYPNRQEDEFQEPAP